MRIGSVWVTFLQWFPILEPTARPATLNSSFAFLGRNMDAFEVPEPLPVLASLGKLTPLSNRELLGLDYHRGAESIWRCLSPVHPVQVVPQLEIEIGRTDALFTRPEVRAFLHPFGLVLHLRVMIKPADGTELNAQSLPRVLNNVERNRTLRLRARAFQTKRSVVSLFDAVARATVHQICDEKVKVSAAEEPFCILTLLGDALPDDVQTLDASSNDAFELFCALERRTSSNRSSILNMKQRITIDTGRDSQLRQATGWLFATANGVASHISSARSDHALRASVCHHRNLAKLLGFFRLFQSYLEQVDRDRPDSIPIPTLEYAIDCYDRMAINYSRWWIRWGTAVLRLDEPVRSSVAAYGLHRRNPHDRQAERSSGGGRNTVVVSYSHLDDERWLKKVRTVLRPLERDGLIDFWADTRIQAGARWRDEIQASLSKARVAILLVSSNYLGSDFVAADELPLLLRRAADGGLTILPLLLSPSRYEDGPLNQFQALNSPGQTLIQMTEADQELTLVKLSRRVEELLQSKRLAAPTDR